MMAGSLGAEIKFRDVAWRGTCTWYDVANRHEALGQKTHYTDRISNVK
jgi:hypothetical protein